MSGNIPIMLMLSAPVPWPARAPYPLRRVDGCHLAERGTNKTVGHKSGVDKIANRDAKAINVDSECACPAPVPAPGTSKVMMGAGFENPNPTVARIMHTIRAPWRETRTLYREGVIEFIIMS